MANFTTSEDIVNGALRRAGEVTDGNSGYEDRIVDYVNNMHHSLLAGGNLFDIDLGEPFVWAKAEHAGVIELIPAVNTGTVSLTVGSTSGTFSSAPAASQAGNYIKIDDRPEYFRIATHTAAATAFTLDANYTDTTGTTLSFNSYKLDYPLTSGVMRLFSPMVTYRNQGVSITKDDSRIFGTDLSSLQREFPLVSLKEGTPTRFAQKYDSDGTITVRMNHTVKDITRVEYDYIPVPTDLTDSSGEKPLIPREARPALEYGAAFFILLDKNDERSQQYFSMTQRAVKALVEANRKELSHTSQNKGKLIPRLDQVVQRRLIADTD